jgi:hypothetical protein
MLLHQVASATGGASASFSKKIEAQAEEALMVNLFK